MRPGATRVVTLGSVVWLDDTASEYLRLPRSEAPRERPEWSDARAGPLQDAVWHPMSGWRVGPVPWHDNGAGECTLGCPGCPGLIVDYPAPDDILSAWFPNAQVG